MTLAKVGYMYTILLLETQKLISKIKIVIGHNWGVALKLLPYNIRVLPCDLSQMATPLLYGNNTWQHSY